MNVNAIEFDVINLPEYHRPATAETFRLRKANIFRDDEIVLMRPSTTDPAMWDVVSEYRVTNVNATVRLIHAATHRNPAETDDLPRLALLVKFLIGQ